MVLVDTNVIMDVLNGDPVWSPWSVSQLRGLSAVDELAVNLIVYAEIAPRFVTEAALDERLEDMGLILAGIPKGAAFLASKAYVRYRKQSGTKTNVLADFFIGAHASVLGCPLLTRDTKRYSTYFPSVRLIHP